jgi:pimeloyl-ACP methyl ester carboxylesterase
LVPETQYVTANGIHIAYETFGEDANPAVLLIAGLAVQMLSWPDELCQQIADAGYHVIRFDNRDVGLSMHIETALPLSTIDVIRGQGVYEIVDMAKDAIGLMDALGLETAHLAGASMGGFIAQAIALRNPKRVRSLTLLMTSTGSRRVGRPRPDVLWRMTRQGAAGGRDAVIANALETFRMIGSRAYPFDAELVRDIAGRSFDRNYDPAGRRRQLAAVFGQPDRTKDLARLTVPTVVIHGLADLVVSPSGGLALARVIPGARLLGFSGMAHDLPRALWSRVVDELVYVANEANGRTQPAVQKSISR